MRPAILAVLVSACSAFGSPAQAPAPQNPSPMSDTTRPHPRVTQESPRGQRAAIGAGTLFIREGLRPRDRLALVVHFHGAPWLVERHVATAGLDAALVTFQLGSGSGVYGKAFADASAFGALLEEARTASARLLGRRVSFDPVVLTSFSAGYGAVRAILRVPDHFARVGAVILADSLHAGYEGDAGAPRSLDPKVASQDLDVFLRLASEAAAGRKHLLVTHSEVFPGTYASTTETADALLGSAGVARRARLAEGPLGMQQLSDSGRGSLRVLGFAGNSAPDHMDHLYALGNWLRRLDVLR
ncbi:MAG: hypothetical protein AB7Q16_17280 [Vicinamibacterales bacterium]